MSPIVRVRSKSFLAAQRHHYGLGSWRSGCRGVSAVSREVQAPSVAWRSGLPGPEGEPLFWVMAPQGFLQSCLCG